MPQQNLTFKSRKGKMKKIMSLTPVLGLFLAAGAWAGPTAAGTHLSTRLPAAAVRAQADCALLLDVKLPKGWQLDPKIPLRWRFSEIYAGFTFTRRKENLFSPTLPIRIPFKATPGTTGARLIVDFRYCPKSGKDSCANGNADYLVVVKADAQETKTEIPVIINSKQ